MPGTSFSRRHTQIELAFWPDANPPEGCHILELGCGPGFYACQLAGQFAQLRVTGIDSAEQQLQRARRRAAERYLPNCRFEHADVYALPQANVSVDAVIAARLFTIVSDHEQVLAEMYRLLRPGGHCFIAEPRSALRAMLPLGAMWFLATLSTLGQTHPAHYREPRRVTILPLSAFGRWSNHSHGKRSRAGTMQAINMLFVRKGEGRLGITHNSQLFTLNSPKERLC